MAVLICTCRYFPHYVVNGFSLIVLFTLATASIISAPEDAEARKGDTVMFRCSVNSALGDIQFHHQLLGSTMIKTIYFKEDIFSSYTERFSVSCNAGRLECELRITNVNVADAGRYMCKHYESTASAELVVFETYPSKQFCSPFESINSVVGENDCNVTPDDIRMSCKMKYYGNLAPVLEWRDIYRNVILNSSVSRDVDDNAVSTVNMKAESTTSITCSIRYPSSNIVSKLSWTKDVEVLILCNSSSTIATSCSSDIKSCSYTLPNTLLKNPTCSSKWTFGNGTIYDEHNSSLDLKNFPSGTYECNAYCSIKKQLCVIRQRTIIHNCSSDSNSENINYPAASTNPGIIVGVVVPVAVIIVAVVVILVILRKCKKKKGPNPEPCGNPLMNKRIKEEDKENNDGEKVTVQTVSPIDDPLVSDPGNNQNLN